MVKSIKVEHSIAVIVELYGILIKVKGKVLIKSYINLSVLVLKDDISLLIDSLDISLIRSKILDSVASVKQDKI